MAIEIKSSKPSLRNNIIVAFFLAITIWGICLITISQYILHGTLVEEGLDKTIISLICKQFTTIYTGFIMAALMIVLFIGWSLSKKITKPINKLTEGVMEVAQGNLDVQIDIPNYNEFGLLAASFKKMTEDLKRTTTSIDNLNKEIAERKQAQAELEAAQEKLIETARRAGMAEVATGVLHNVGNVLTSVRTTAESIQRSVRNSKVSYLTEVVGLFEEHKDNLSTFLTTREQGKKLPVFLATLSEELISEQARYLEALQTLTKHVKHMTDIIHLQQSYSKTIGLVEPTSIIELVEDSIQINAQALNRHNVEVKREFADLPPVLIDSHKILQILTNLISNAKYALSDNGRDDKILTIYVRKPQDGYFRIEVHDNGTGITKENLTRIFEHGFTTKKDGYGFGLHSAAIAAREINGSLSAHSDGPGKGTVLILELPFQTKEAEK